MSVCSLTTLSLCIDCHFKCKQEVLMVRPLSLCLSSQCLSVCLTVNSRRLMQPYRRVRASVQAAGRLGEGGRLSGPAVLSHDALRRYHCTAASSAAQVTVHETVKMTAHILLLVALCFTQAFSEGTSLGLTARHTHCFSQCALYTWTHIQRDKYF